MPLWTQHQMSRIPSLKKVRCRLQNIFTPSQRRDLLGPFFNFNYIHYEVWDEITISFPNINGFTVEISAWISNFIPNFIMDEIIYPCWDLSESLLVKWATEVVIHSKTAMFSNRLRLVVKANVLKPSVSRLEFRIVYKHYSDVIMGALVSQITSVSIVYSTVCSGTDPRKHQSSASLAFVRGIHREPVNSPHKRPVTRKMSPFDDVIMKRFHIMWEPRLFDVCNPSTSYWFSVGTLKHFSLGMKARCLGGTSNPSLNQ